MQMAVIVRKAMYGIRFKVSGDAFHVRRGVFVA